MSVDGGDRIAAFFEACQLWIEPPCAEIGLVAGERKSDGQSRAGQQFDAPDLMVLTTFQQSPQNWCSTVTVWLRLPTGDEENPSKGPPWVPDFVVMRGMGLDGAANRPLPLEPTGEEVRAGVEEAAARLRRIFADQDRALSLLRSQYQRWMEAQRAKPVASAAPAFFLRSSTPPGQPDPQGWIDYFWTREDYVATVARSIHTAASNREIARRMRRASIVPVLIYLFMFSLVIGFALRSLQVAWRDAAIAAAGLTGIIGCGSAVMTLSLRNQLARLKRASVRVAKRAEPSKFNSRQRLTLLRRGIHCGGGAATITHSWKAVSKIDLTDAHVVFDTERGSILIPRQAFPGSAEASQFVAMARELCEAASASRATPEATIAANPGPS